jgi:acyl-coenzyme A synthetase/AMP-(fatty) acid ligase
MQPSTTTPDLRGLLLAQELRPDAAISDARARVALNAILSGTCLDRDLDEFAGRSILLATSDQLTTALALIELDGIASRLILCTNDVDQGYLGDIASTAAVDLVIYAGDPARFADLGLPMILARPELTTGARTRPAARHTEWILMTSGTTGAPKLVRHDLASLIAPIRSTTKDQDDAVWATFYDIRRYGGLQIFLRAMLGGASMVLSDANEPVTAHLQRLGHHRVTHISGTPSHWRRVLMSGHAQAMAPRYVRLSGEIADQAILDALQGAYPNAGVSHAYASTEAGVGFNVIDGKEGFPSTLISDQRPDAEIRFKVEDGTLRIRSPRTAVDYLGEGRPAIRTADGFVDTGDIVELRAQRYVFVGRRGGVINVGGQKVHPEEIEAVINRHPAVRMSLVRARRNSITGSLVVADVVIEQSATESERLADDILAHCRSILRPYKVPARIRFVPNLAVAATGKLARLP